MKKAYLVIALGFIVIIGFVVNQFFVLGKAHSTFENYYAFRGCTNLVERTSDSGTCKVATGATIKIVKFQNKWYLDGDLPICLFGFCY